MLYFRQCSFVNGEKRLHAWIPETLTKAKFVRFDDLGDQWKIEEVSTTRLTTQEMMDRSQDYKRTRKASDI